jgi:hypothetical protein
MVFPTAGVPPSRVTVALDEPDRATLVPPTVIVVFSAAFAGATDSKPVPNANTATSAMRLRSVFVDIYFLSISQDQEFPDLGFG